jgi:hypothetical protein
MVLDDTRLRYDEKGWYRESEELDNKIKELNERNGLLESENELLKYKLNIALDMVISI